MCRPNKWTFNRLTAYFCVHLKVHNVKMCQYLQFFFFLNLWAFLTCTQAVATSHITARGCDAVMLIGLWRQVCFWWITGRETRFYLCWCNMSPPLLNISLHLLKPEYFQVYFYFLLYRAQFIYPSFSLLEYKVYIIITMLIIHNL